MVFNMSGTPTVCSPHTHKLTYLHTYLHTYHHRPSITLILPLPFSLSLLSLSLKKLVTCGVIRSFNLGKGLPSKNQWEMDQFTKGSSRGATLSFTLRSKGEGGQPRYLILQEIASHFSNPPPLHTSHAP